MKIKRVRAKSGKIYEYDASKYKYKHKSTRGLTLVGKNGAVYRKIIEKLKETIDANDNYSRAEKIYLKSELDDLVKRRHNSKEKLTSSGFFGKQESDEVRRLFINAGYDPKEVADIYGFDPKHLLNPENWQNNEYKDPTGAAFEFAFTYTGELFTRL